MCGYWPTSRPGLEWTCWVRYVSRITGVVNENLEGSEAKLAMQSKLKFTSVCPCQLFDITIRCQEIALGAGSCTAPRKKDRDASLCGLAARQGRWHQRGQALEAPVALRPTRPSPRGHVEDPAPRQLRDPQRISGLNGKRKANPLGYGMEAIKPSRSTHLKTSLEQNNCTSHNFHPRRGALLVVATYNLTLTLRWGKNAMPFPHSSLQTSQDTQLKVRARFNHAASVYIPIE